MSFATGIPLPWALKKLKTGYQNTSRLSYWHYSNRNIPILFPLACGPTKRVRPPKSILAFLIGPKDSMLLFFIISPTATINY